ncbi:selenocysteine-specific translation elongation factor [Sulfurovum sp. ST-21]|uniref:Selenocysteine-specific elongation factor n=1 Tax=Sulfurovum indicum TaxID=2779528 RepID=A0A7M1S4I8_9BACT|nr:selenocysteine-specific translation elongation factor [Sulfurovum indicum]QOR61270.1 selenocysteine-specific translation elongation factor [Sulfurovum indicum]
MRHLVVGTAGHVDHGKTALIKALNGFEGDTLGEEKKRGITIDLSFSHMQDQNTNIAFVDVPGHEKLIKNMIAGAFGFDATLVVIDAREGVMPQTNEHLEILNLLKVPYIIIALTKCDLVSQEKINDRVSEIKTYIDTFAHLKLKAIVPVSIYLPKSIALLKEELFGLPIVQKKSNGLFRYYVDRAFSLPGIGTVVTGTILDGEVKAGDKVFVAEQNQELIVRNIQVHEKDVPCAYTSQRAALNLQNPKQTLSRGLLLTTKGYIKGFTQIDVWFDSISGQKIEHNTQMMIFIGTKQIEVKVLLYEEDAQIRGFAKLQFGQKIYTVFNEPFILSLSGRVVAGGMVLNPVNDPIKKRLKLPLLKSLAKSDFSAAFKILVTMHKRGFGLISSNQRFGIGHEKALLLAKEMEHIFIDEKGLVLYDISVKRELEEKIMDIYKKNKYAMLSAKSLCLKETWASETLISDILEKLSKENRLLLDNGIYRDPNIDVKDVQTVIQTKIFSMLLDEGVTPKAPYNIYDALDIDRKMGDRVLKKLTSAKKVKRLQHNLFVPFESLIQLMTHLQQIIKNEGYIDIALFKVYYPNLSRKYLIAYLEYLDTYPTIRKEGLKRVFI